MTNTPEETARRFEQQAQVQREQFDMIRAQQESIVSLKQMLAQLLEDKRKSTDKTSSKKSKGKQKEGESSSSVHIEEKEQSTSKSSKSSSKGGGNPDHGRIHSKRMSQLEQRLEALTNRKGSKKQEWSSHIRPNGTLFHTPKFKAPTLQAFDGKGSPNQHIYYFKSQTGNVVDNDAILVRLFIGLSLIHI